MKETPFNGGGSQLPRRDQIESPPDLFCRKCGATYDFIKLREMDEAAELEPVCEVRCANGHLLVRFVRPDQRAIDRGCELAEKYGW